MKIKRKVLTCSLRVLVFIIAFLVIGISVFAIIQIRGKKSLYQNVKYIKPELSSIENAQLIEEPIEKTENYIWQEGDIRYQGEIYRYNEDMLTFLILGIDSMNEVKRKEVGISGGQSDAIFLLCLDPHSKKISVIGVNRDTIADIDVYTKEGNFMATMPGQITLQHGYGDGAEISCERSLKSIRRLFYDIPIHGYCAINMGAIPLINDKVGGIEVTALESFQTKNFTFIEGENTLLMGMAAYDYLQHRDVSVFNSADKRLERQKQYLTAYAQKVIAQTKADITIPVQIYQTLSKYMVTDISVDEVTYLVSQALAYQFSSEQIYSLEGETVMGDKHEEFYVNQEALYDLIMRVFYERVSE